MQQLTLVYLLKNGQVCLGYKKRGHGDGYWNGFGGKTEPGESVLQAAVRELHEECQVTVGELDLRLMAQNEFVYPHEDKHYLVHTFVTEWFTGDPTESSEMKPRWFSITELPYGEMWETDRLWLQSVLTGTPLRFRAVFDESGRSATETELELVTGF